MNKVREILLRTWEYLRSRKRDYQFTFGSPAGQAVLYDLARFCRANQTTFSADARLHAVAEGRREVWLRIQNHLGMTPAQLFEFYSNQPVTVTTLEDDNG